LSGACSILAAVRALILVGAVLAVAGVARAQETTPGPIPQLYLPAGGAPPGAVGRYTELWPVTLAVHTAIGFEPQGARGNPVAFGVGVEAMWHGRVGGFASVLSSSGTPIRAAPTGMVDQNGQPTTLPSLGDRISVPFGVVYRPFTTLLPNGRRWVRQLLAGMGVQLGLTVEHVRTSDDSATVAGLDVGASAEVPIFGGPTQSGLTFRVQGRMMVTQQIRIDTKITQSVFEDYVNGQLFAGICYYP
jgi:hypothetical protein